MTIERRWLRATCIACTLLCGLFGPIRAHAAGPVVVRTNEHDYLFGRQIRFRLDASGETAIESVTLSYQTSDLESINVKALPLESSRTVRVEYVHEIDERYVRPFVEVTYWWTLVDANGASLTTEPRSFDYVDDRFAWQTLQHDGVILHWYAGELEIAQQALSVAQQALSRAGHDLSLQTVQRAVRIYLYASAADLGPALPAGLPAGADALTLYESDVVLVPFAPVQANIPALRRTLPHEVTHALVYGLAQEGHGRVPLWVSEGLATSIEYAFAPDPDAQDMLDQALAGQRVLPLRVLCAEFPGDWEAAQLAYVESASVIDYVRDLYGREALHDLVAAYADGATCDGGVQRVLGTSLDRLQMAWREREAPRGPWATFWERSGAWVILVALVIAVPVVPTLLARPWSKRDR